MKKIKSILNNSNGAISIFAVMMMVILLPMAIWVGIELPKMHEANERVKDAVDTAASSAVTLIDGENSNFGEAEVKFQSSSETIAYQIVLEKLGVENDAHFTPKEGSNIKEDSVEIEWTPLYPGDGMTLMNGKYISVEKPTILVEAKVTYKKIGWWGDDLTIYHTGMSQISMNWNP